MGETISDLYVRHMRVITGASNRQLDYWASIGLLSPSAGTPGSRLWKEYTIDDAICCRMIVALREQGVSLQQIRKALARLNRKLRNAANPSDELRRQRLIVYKGKIYVEDSLDGARRAVYRAVDGQSTFLFMNLDRVGKEVDDAMEELRRKSLEPSGVH